MIRIKRIYETPSKADGYRILVDRLWPRRVTKEAACLDLWSKEMAPSSELRKWFNHDPTRFEEFSDRYYAELTEKSDVIKDIVSSSNKKTITLLYAARDAKCNHAIVLKDFLSNLGLPPINILY